MLKYKLSGVFPKIINNFWNKIMLITTAKRENESLSKKRYLWKCYVVLIEMKNVSLMSLVPWKTETGL